MCLWQTFSVTLKRSFKKSIFSYRDTLILFWSMYVLNPEVYLWNFKVPSLSDRVTDVIIPCLLPTLLWLSMAARKNRYQGRIWRASYNINPDFRCIYLAALTFELALWRHPIALSLNCYFGDYQSQLTRNENRMCFKMINWHCILDRIQCQLSINNELNFHWISFLPLYRDKSAFLEYTIDIFFIYT